MPAPPLPGCRLPWASAQGPRAVYNPPGGIPMRAAVLRVLATPINPASRTPRSPWRARARRSCALRAAALNHRDAWIRRGLYAGIKLPDIVLGSDGAGEVAAAGDGVDRALVGFAGRHQPQPRVGRRRAFAGAEVAHSGSARGRHARRTGEGAGLEPRAQAGATELGAGGGDPARGPDGLPRAGLARRRPKGRPGARHRHRRRRGHLRARHRPVVRRAGLGDVGERGRAWRAPASWARRAA